uniref:Uncharacterized protein n=1 Tax=Oncorhynchus mykiss TaxID=8022 RepID=A0A8C7U7T6_ONCMY
MPQTDVGPVICSTIIKLTLYCMNGEHHLKIHPDGTVGGKRDENDIHSKTRNSRIFHNVGVNYMIGICGIYLHYNNTAGYSIVTDPCYFLEKMEVNHYNTYQEWTKLDSRTHIGQKAIFLSRRL